MLVMATQSLEHESELNAPSWLPIWLKPCACVMGIAHHPCVTTETQVAHTHVVGVHALVGIFSADLDHHKDQLDLERAEEKIAGAECCVCCATTTVITYVIIA